MRLIKFTQVVYAVWFILVMLMMFQGSLFIPLISQPGTVSTGGQQRTMTSNEQVAVTALFTLMLIVGGEVVRNWVRQAFKVDAGKLASSTDTAASAMGTVSLIRNLVGLPLLLLATLAANVFLCYGLVQNISTHQGPLPWPFWMVVGIYAVYLVIRRPLIRLLKSGTRQGTRGGKVAASLVSTFTIEGNVILLDLKRKRGRPRAERSFVSVGTEPCIVRIHFDELDEIRAFSYVEAQAYVQYQIGPDLQIALKGTGELLRYLSGEIERPAHYGHWGSIGTTLLLRGPQLFYLISVLNDNVDELLEAFKAYKAGGLPPAPAAS